MSWQHENHHIDYFFLGVSLIVPKWISPILEIHFFYPGSIQCLADICIKLQRM